MVPISKLHSFPHRFDPRGSRAYMKQQQQHQRLPWDSWLTMAVGVAIGVSPWAFRFTGLDYATLNAVIVGMLVFALAALTLTLLDRWEAWVTLGLGFWLSLSPWLLGYELYAAAALPHIGFGLLVIALSILTLWRGWGLDEE